MSLQQAQDHQRRHGFSAEGLGNVKTAEKAPGDSRGILVRPVKMTRPEREMTLILEARKRRGDIEDYRFEGISLSWGADPATGKKMWYTADFYVRDCFGEETLIETKGAHIWDRDLVRWKGCRAEWGKRFKFELHQLKAGVWTRLQ